MDGQCEKLLPENSSPDESIGGRGSAEFKKRSFYEVCHALLFDDRSKVVVKNGQNRLLLALVSTIPPSKRNAVGKSPLSCE